MNIAMQMQVDTRWFTILQEKSGENIEFCVQDSGNYKRFFMPEKEGKEKIVALKRIASAVV